MSAVSHFAVVAAVAIGLCMSSCRQRKSEPSTPATTGDSGAETTEAKGPPKAAMGLYECTLVVDDETLVIQKCEVTKAQVVSMAGPSAKLTANLTPRDFGFALGGTIQIGETETAIAAELFSQGEGSYAAVFQVGAPSKRLVRITLEPVQPGLGAPVNAATAR